MSEKLARRFHEVYERLAPKYGYSTREETREFDAESPNGKLMIRVCGEVCGSLQAEVERLCEDNERLQAKVDRDRLTARGFEELALWNFSPESSYQPRRRLLHWENDELRDEINRLRGLLSKSREYVDNVVLADELDEELYKDLGNE